MNVPTGWKFCCWPWETANHIWEPIVCYCSCVRWCCSHTCYTGINTWIRDLSVYVVIFMDVTIANAPKFTRHYCSFICWCADNSWMLQGSWCCQNILSMPQSLILMLIIFNNVQSLGSIKWFYSNLFCSIFFWMSNTTFPSSGDRQCERWSAGKQLCEPGVSSRSERCHRQHILCHHQTCAGESLTASAQNNPSEVIDMWCHMFKLC